MPQIEEKFSCHFVLPSNNWCTSLLTLKPRDPKTQKMKDTKESIQNTKEEEEEEEWNAKNKLENIEAEEEEKCALFPSSYTKRASICI